MAALQRLSGKVAVVTGATSGIGLAIAQRFVDEGWKLVNDRLDKVFASYSDRELHREVATHRNRVYYLLGHLTVAHDRLLPLLRLGDRLHPEVEEECFSNHADKDVLGTHVPTPAGGHIISDKEGCVLLRPPTATNARGEIDRPQQK